MKNSVYKNDENPKEIEILDLNNDLEKVNTEEAPVPKPVDLDNEEKMDAESIQQRRISQNSDLNDHRDSTPMQTDNEEVIDFFVYT